ncbi:MAG: protein-tyrosine phosphatase family protein [Paracoccaceae bacterium]
MFEIFEVTLGAGLLGISPMPGRGGAFEADLSALLRWDPALVLSMPTAQEMAQRGAGGLGDDLRNAGVDWAHLPVPDFGAPASETTAMWQRTSAKAHQIIVDGGRVLAHCHGGCGRSGMVLLRLMAEAGEVPEAALKRLRKSRACAVETDEQFAWAAAGFGDG